MTVLVKRSRRYLALATILLVLQVVWTCIVPLADAWRDGTASAISLHIEAQDTDCPEPHDHLDCLLCRASGARFFVGTLPALHLSSTRTLVAGRSRHVEGAVATARFIAIIPRAPPA